MIYKNADMVTETTEKGKNIGDFEVEVTFLRRAICGAREMEC